ncbi:hypothetical protein Adt_32679 [Abeliophyllum distichum]|uniref:Uncharacterized protein n=1 Tax=Abeliophyllum distichum TaxID=126358 RepID=A0ABD1QU79_9LAMI
MENFDRHNDVFTVMKLTDDNNIISRYVDYNVENKGSDLLSKIEKNDDECDNVLSSNDEVKTPSKDQRNNVICDDGPKSRAAKRSLCGDMSSNVAHKKLKSMVKEEKE